MRQVRSLVLSGFSVAILVGATERCALAQFGNAWLTLTPHSEILRAADGSSADLLANTDEKDFAVGDLNQDGWPDLLVVKSVQATLVGPREGRLLLNEKGILVDRTATHGTQSLSAALGDLGFRQALESSDVEIGDLDGDGFADALGVQYDLTNSTAAAAKRLTHPRVYMNLGQDHSGNWLGLRHEDARIPQLITLGGINGVVRFMDGALGDVDNDGDLDLYFSDFDADENGHTEPATGDLNDRLLINDGNGYFADETFTRFATAAMWSSAYGTQSGLQDINGDGKVDIVKVSTLHEAINRIEAIYNDLNPVVAPNFVGGFDSNPILDSGENYAFALSDLNNDTRLDLVVGDLVVDHYRFNLGNDATGAVLWTEPVNFTWLTGSGEQFYLGAIYSHDYDLDGWNDVINVDVYPDLPGGCVRRSQIFHNRGGIPGATDIILAEEKQQPGAGGWFGAVGWTNQSPKGVFDIASVDYDRDGDLDLILGKCSGTEVWRNEKNPVTCQPSVAPTSLGDATLSLCGAPLHSNLSATLTIQNGPANGSAVLLVSATSATVPLFGGQVLVPFNLAVAVPLDGTGTFTLTVPGGGGSPTGTTIYAQALVVAPGSPNPTELTNVLAATVLD